MATATLEKQAVCLCGCGEATNPRRDFRQGHDQRLVSMLAEEVVTGEGNRLGFDALPEAWTPGDMIERIERARRVVADQFSAGLATKFESAALNRAKRARTKKTPAVVQRPSPAQAPAPVGEPSAMDKLEGRPVGLGAPVKFKVGKRHKVYEGTVHGMNQAGKITSVAYVTPAGAEQTSTNFTLVQ